MDDAVKKMAALYVGGKIITGDNHLEAYQKLSPKEKVSDFTTGFFDKHTGRFESDVSDKFFYNKEIFIMRHGATENADADDPTLSSKGIQQIKHIAKKLKKFDHAKIIF